MPNLGEMLHALGSAALTWLPIVFFGAMIYLLWRTLQYMPRVKPQAIESDSSSSVTWEDVAGVDEAKAELQEVVDFLREPGALRAARRAGARRACSSTARPAPARRCSPRPSPTSRARTSTRRAPRRSSRCSPASAPRGSASSSRRPARTRRRSSSSTSSTRSAPRASGSGFNREQDQTLNQLLVELDGFGERDAGRRHGRVEPAPGPRPRAAAGPAASTGRCSSPPPDLAGREAILRVHTRGKPLAADVDLERRRAADRRPDRRRPREHLQRGRDLRRPPRGAD